MIIEKMPELARVYIESEDRKRGVYQFGAFDDEYAHAGDRDILYVRFDRCVQYLADQGYEVTVKKN